MKREDGCTTIADEGAFFVVAILTVTTSSRHGVVPLHAVRSLDAVGVFVAGCAQRFVFVVASSVHGRRVVAAQTTRPAVPWIRHASRVLYAGAIGLQLAFTSLSNWRRRRRRILILVLRVGFPERRQSVSGGRRHEEQQ